MFLPPSNLTPNIAPASNPLVEDRGLKFTGKARIITTLTKWSAYGFFFCVGVTVAHVSRLIPHAKVLYLAFVIVLGSYLLFTKPKGASVDLLSLRRLCGLALACSIVVWWDAIAQLAFLPLSVFGLVFLPLWQIMVLIGFVALFLFGLTLVIKQ
jgi:hypothetical protein